MKQLGLTLYNPEMAFPGYTLFAPLEGTNAYLLDMRGNIVHRWQLPYRPGDYGYLLENGNLLVGCHTGRSPVPFGGKGGIVMEMTWEGETLWEYVDDMLHHDFCRMPNGNTMVLGWELVPPDLAKRIKGGTRGPSTRPVSGPTTSERSPPPERRSGSGTPTSTLTRKRISSVSSIGGTSGPIPTPARSFPTGTC